MATWDWSGRRAATRQLDPSLPHAVVIGGGFGGLAVTRALKRAPVRISLVDRRNHHLFQPLLYQIAIAGLSPADIAAPIRSILRKQRNVTVLMAEATGAYFAHRTVKLRDDALAYDFLVLATGGRSSYFGYDEWENYAPGLKDLDDALEIQRRVLLAFETAEREIDAGRRKELMTFVVVGGGLTGVELAGALAELARFVLSRDFRRIDPRYTRIILLEAAPKIMGSFPPDLADSAARQLAKLGVEIRVNA